MKKIILIILLIIPSLVISQIPTYQDVRIEMVGQSNCAGKSQNPLNAYKPLNTNCKIFNTSTLLYETINALTNTGQPTYNGQGYYGIESPLAYKINLLTKKKVFINKYGVDNTSILVHLDANSIYDVYNLADDAIYKLEISNQFITPNTKYLGFVWIQGEADAVSQSSADNYIFNVRLLINNIRSTRKTNAPIILVTPSYNPSLMPYRSTVVAAMNQAASEFSDVYVIDTVSVANDGLHYGDAGIEFIATGVYNIFKNYL